jgi:acyl-CoA thioester hydrolase
MDGYRFSTEIVARFNETDAQGVIHHGVHLLWFEVARIAYLSRLEGGYRGLVESGVDVTTVDANVEYLGPITFDDRIAIWTRCVDVRGARLRFEYALERVSDPPGLVARGSTGHACVDAATLRPTRVPTGLAAHLERLETP